MQPLRLRAVGLAQAGWPASTVPQEAGLRGGWQGAAGWHMKYMEEAGGQRSDWPEEDTQQVGLQERNTRVGGWQGTGTEGTDWQALEV